MFEKKKKKIALVVKSIIRSKWNISMGKSQCRTSMTEIWRVFGIQRICKHPHRKLWQKLTTPCCELCSWLQKWWCLKSDLWQGKPVMSQHWCEWCPLGSIPLAKACKHPGLFVLHRVFPNTFFFSLPKLITKNTFERTVCFAQIPWNVKTGR